MNNTQAIINLKNLQFNFLSIRRKTKTKVMAVVKANAYGHGMIECVKALSQLKNKPEYYCVALLKEGVELRKSKIIKEPILCFAPFDIKDLDFYSKYNIIPSVTSSNNVKVLSRLKLNKSFKVHIKINTGMNRLGVSYKEAQNLIVKLTENKKILIDGIYTHFATSDEKKKQFANLQLSRFKNVVKELRYKNIQIGLIHAANSGAILDMPDSYFDMVRPGISLYGYYPSLETTESIKLKPVMTIVSKISTVVEIDKNETVGYGRLFKAKQRTLVATIPIGYADGFLRGLSNKMRVIVKNKFYNQIGRVSMDRISINLGSDIIKEGSKVILLGRSKNLKITAWDWSKILNTIPYEITCSISKRVERKFIGIS